MAYPRLYTCDLARGRYSSVSSIPDSAYSSQNAVDGDPNSLWVPGAVSSDWGVYLAGARTVRAFALVNHNLVGATVSLHVYHDGILEMITAQLPITSDPFLVDLVTPTTASTLAVLKVIGASSNIKVGCIYILGDYGYDSDGVLAADGGYGIIELGRSASGGITRPLPVGGDTGVRVVRSSNGFPQFQQISAPSDVLTLPFELMRSSLDMELWRLWHAYYPRTRGEFSNPGFSKGVWFTSDEYSVDARLAMYCVGESLGYQVDQAGSRSSGALTLRAIPRDIVS